MFPIGHGGSEWRMKKQETFSWPANQSEEKQVRQVMAIGELTVTFKTKVRWVGKSICVTITVQ